LPKKGLEKGPSWLKEIMVVSVVILTGLDKEGAQKGNDADPNK
jgi:hypothetical protein